MAERLTPEMLEEVILVVRTHTEHDGRYCDTGEDMDWACRSECVEMAVNRLRKHYRDSE